MNDRYPIPSDPRAALDAWLAGELDADTARRFLAEARRDPALAAEVERFTALRDEVARLPRDLEPERDLWPEIAARTVARRTSGRARWLSLGVAAGLLLGVSLLFLLEGRRAPEAARRIVEPPAAPATPALAAYAESERALSAIRDELRREVDARSTGLPPETRAVVFDNLATIDRAIAEIEAALAERPDDPELARTYIAYRQHEIELLRRVNRAAARL